jgi:flagellar basal body-associated protein FliL
MYRPSARSGKKIIMIAIIAVVVLGAAGGGVVLGPRLLKHGDAAAAADKGAEGEKGKDGKAAKGSEKDKAGKGDEGDKKGKGKGKGEEEAEAVVVPLGDFLVNLQSGSQVRYLRAEISIGVKGLPEAKGEGEGKGKPASLPGGGKEIARDRVVAVLSAGDFVSLRTAAGRAKLKQQVLTKLGEAFPDYEVTEVLFTSFVMQ